MKLRLIISTLNPNSILRVVGGEADASNPVAVVQSKNEREEIVKRVNMHDELVEGIKKAVKDLNRPHSDGSISLHELQQLLKQVEGK